MVKKRGNKLYLQFMVNYTTIEVVTEASSKREALRIEHAVKSAIRIGDFRSLDTASRHVCVKIFKNRGWPLPDSLTAPDGNTIIEPTVAHELTLWEAMELCLKYPDVSNSPNKPRHKQSFMQIVKKWGKNLPIKEIWIPKIKEYQLQRLNEGAATSTVNKEKAALSKMFQVLIELQHATVNPARLVKYLSERSSKRHAYIGASDFQRAIQCCQDWFRPIALASYYTGMRRGEILNMNRSRIDLERRLITLEPKHTKTGQWRIIPIHPDLLPVLERALKVQAIGPDGDAVFLKDGIPIREKTQVRWCWEHAIYDSKLKHDIHFHDLRHTWKTNALRSGMPEEVRMLIMGHEDQSTHAGYGLGFLAETLVREMDKVTWDHGPTTLQVESHRQKKGLGKKHYKAVKVEKVQGEVS